MFETIFIILLIISIIIYKSKNKAPIKYVKAYNDKVYVVNDLPDAQEAADMLARIMTVLNKLVDNIINDYNNNLINDEDKEYFKYVKVIYDRLPYVKISENLVNSEFTSYSVNKGEELVFCIRDRKRYKIQPINEILYVAIHEIGHIGSPEVGHTKLFHDINIYLLKKAIKFKLYNYVDYNINNKEYCGLILTTTILNN
jgi:hypothetical protein